MFIPQSYLFKNIIPELVSKYGDNKAEGWRRSPTCACIKIHVWRHAPAYLQGTSQRLAPANHMRQHM